MTDQRFPAGQAEPPPRLDRPFEIRVGGKHELAAAASTLAGGFNVGGGRGARVGIHVFYGNLPGPLSAIYF